jgi:hypothetical protein
MAGFILGAVVGGLVVWLYGRRALDYLEETGTVTRGRAEEAAREARDYVGERTRDARARAADTLRSAAERLDRPTGSS